MRRTHQRTNHQLGHEQGCRRFLLYQRRALDVRKWTWGWGRTCQLCFAINSSLRATGLPYYLLGRVPCRSVSFVAIVVGAVAYERRIVYTREPYSNSPVYHDQSKPTLQWMTEPPPLSARSVPMTRRSQGTKNWQISPPHSSQSVLW